MTAKSYPEGFRELVDAKDEVVKADNRMAIADALLTVERRITISTYWMLGIVVGVVGIATAILLSAFQSLSQT
ncbi:hypothetical protein [Candidatus Spongiisocius sp.]|uniref:hypothetical protein n=1 Tax=Candidatus Spongiisocius sp. TaxID=3101273 RepID=UPI003B58CF67